MALYSLAVVAFCAQLAFGRRPARAPELVGAGGARCRRPHDAGRRGPAAAAAGALVAMGLTVLGALTHAGVLVTRGLATDRLPWGNMYEFATATVLVAVVAYVVLRRPGARRCGTSGCSCSRPVVLALVLIGLFLYADAGPLVAALRSYWLAIHVTTAIIGFGIFFVSGIASVMYLVRSRYEARLADGAAPESRHRREAARRRRAGPRRPPHRRLRLPDLDLRGHRRRHLGRGAWGRFWGWDPKETWAFIAWVVYAAYLHARTTAGWRGRPAAWVNVVGLVVMIFNLLFVNMVSTGLHSYAGVS